jgi:hypothetical protein
LHFDGNWIDLGSLCTGAIYSVVRHIRVIAPTVPFLSVQTGVGFASGTALFPLVILILGSMSTDLEKALLGSSKITLAVAGFVALCALLEEVARPKKSS